MASGKYFNMNEFTVAHKTLPFGTEVEVKVVNLRKGQKIVVNINERGPFNKKRIINLSYPGAKAIGLVKIGVARVRLEIIVSFN